MSAMLNSPFRSHLSLGFYHLQYSRTRWSDLSLSHSRVQSTTCKCVQEFRLQRDVFSHLPISSHRCEKQCCFVLGTIAVVRYAQSISLRAIDIGARSMYWNQLSHEMQAIRDHDFATHNDTRKGTIGNVSSSNPHTNEC
jgi:hypothetical protein